MGGVYHGVTGGLVIKNTENCCISLTDTQNVIVSGVSTVNARRDASRFGIGSHIEVISHGAGCATGLSSPRDIVISGHMAFDGSLPSHAAVTVTGSGAGAAIIGLAIFGNNYATTGFASGGPLAINPTYWTSSTCRHANNTGAGD
jgi:hypothetical protein